MNAWILGIVIFLQKHLSSVYQPIDAPWVEDDVGSIRKSVDASYLVPSISLPLADGHKTIMTLAVLGFYPCSPTKYVHFISLLFLLGVFLALVSCCSRAQTLSFRWGLYRMEESSFKRTNRLV